jgi:3-oxoadipate enol-lactonase
MGAVNGYAVSADGVHIAFCDEGPRDRPAIFFCTMGTAALAVWDPIVEPLAIDWRVIRHDRRGDGHSQPGAEESHTFATYVRDALRVMDQVSCDVAMVCGMAFGARVALHLARDAPRRVSALTLFDATGGPPAPEAQRTAGRAAAAQLRRQAQLPPVAADRRWFFRGHPEAATYGRRALEGQPAWMTGLDAIGAPTLIACGEQDPNLAGSKRLAGELPNATFTAMPMTGHASILERPDLVLALLQDFLGRRAPTDHRRRPPSDEL